MNYEQAVSFLESKVIFGITPGLERIKALSHHLGNPHQNYPVIQVTGTNGKTSVVRMLTSILTKLGFDVGSYTSPHLQSYTERITLGREFIERTDFAQALFEIIPFVEKVSQEAKEPLTHFEILTGLAFYYFSKQQVDCAVLEVGMGGRWDATSITKPCVSVVTNVELEHTERLGETVKKIAEEKAYVVKENSKVVIGELKSEALEVVARRCKVVGASLKVMGRDFSLTSYEAGKEGFPRIDVKGLFGEYDNLKLSLLGKHQGKNAILAVAAAERFCSKPLSITCLRKGLFEVAPLGRMEIVQENPKVVLDGAHNPSGTASLLEALNQEFSYLDLILVLGVLRDKDIDEMLNKLIPKAATVVLTQSHSKRAISAQALGEKAKSFGANLVVEPALTKAIDVALKQADSRDLVLITGSLYTVGEARDYFDKVKKRSASADRRA